MNKRYLAAFLVVAVILSASFCALSLEESKTLILSATQRVSYDPNGDIVIEGNAKITFGDIVITSNVATVNQSEKKVYINEKFKLAQGDYVALSGNKMFGDFVNLYIEVDVNAELLRLEDDSRVNAEYIKIFTENQDFEAKGKVVITRGNQIATSDFCIYRNDSNSVDLSGNVFILGSNGETVRADKATIDLNNESFVAEAQEGGEIVITIEIV